MKKCNSCLSFYLCFTICMHCVCSNSDIKVSIVLGHVVSYDNVFFHRIFVMDFSPWFYILVSEWVQLGEWRSESSCSWDAWVTMNVSIGREFDASWIILNVVKSYFILGLWVKRNSKNLLVISTYTCAWV